MIPRHHLRLFHQTTKLLSRIIPVVLLLACSSKAVEENSADTTDVTTAVTTTPVTQPAETKKGPPPGDGPWNGDLNYVLDVPEGTADDKEIVVIIATSSEEQKRLFSKPDVESEIIYTINQPKVLRMLDTVMTYHEGVVMVDDCFTTTVWYHVQLKDQSTEQVYDGWIPNAPGVYSIAGTRIGGARYSFEGIQDSLWLGAMTEAELDMRYVNKEYDPATADNCRNVIPLFFYNGDKIYMIDGEVEDQWHKPGFNMTLGHLAIVRALPRDLVVTGGPKSVHLSFESDSKASLAVVASRGRLKVDSVIVDRY